MGTPELDETTDVRGDKSRVPGGANRAVQSSWPRVVLVLVAIAIAGGLAALFMCIRGCTKGIPEAAEKVGQIPVKELEKALNLIEKLFETKDAFQSSLGEITRETKTMKLQFAEREQVLFFRVVRYRGSSMSAKPAEIIEWYRKESDKSKTPAVAGQYTEWEAKGAFDITYYVDMSDPKQWECVWDGTRSRLTFTAPAIQANLPAETEPLTYRCVADCVTVDEDYTKKVLENAIPRLKAELAAKQAASPSIKELGRTQICEFFKTWIEGRIRADKVKAAPAYDIEVRFADE